MAHKKLIVANWKLNNTPEQAQKFATHFLKKYVPHRNVQAVICPTYLALPELFKTFEGTGVALGAQNFWFADHGTFTGEVSAAMLTPYVDYSIVGHSDRRYTFGEDDEIIARKMAASLRNSIKPILCVGENLVQRQALQTDLVLHDQVIAALSMLTTEDLEDVTIAYEPLWAISKGDGQGEHASPREVEKAVKAIRRSGVELCGKTAADNMRILYGGSSSPDNAKAYLNLPHVDGLLVGGHSLIYEHFVQMIEIAHEIK